MAKKPIILIVDDEKTNIRLLKAMLAPKGYDLREAALGEEALLLATDILPDMVILDVMMPGIDGFEVCQRLKIDDRTRLIPVIMVTSLSEKQHRLKAMECGADDFISKPVDSTELHIRVKSLLRIKANEDELLLNYKEISDKNAKLKELEKIRDGLVHMIVHDLRNPLTAISGFMQLMLIEKQNLLESQQERIQQSLHFCEELNRMIQTLLDINKIEEGKLKLNREMTSVVDLIEDSLERFRPTIEGKKISLCFSATEDIPLVPLDREIMKRVIVNLVDNAIRYALKGGNVEVAANFSPEKGSLCLSVKDNGSGLPKEYHQKVFDKFEQVQLKKDGYRSGSSGLGLTFCKMAVEAHGGRIWVESDGLNKGCTFNILIPVSS